MYVPKTSKGFLKYVNNISLTEEEKDLVENSKKEYEKGRANYNQIFSILKYLGNDLGFVELIYCYKKRINKPDQFQQIMAVSEKHGVYGKNCYYQDYGCARGFHVFFTKKGIRSWYTTEKYSDSLIEYNDFINEKCCRTLLNPDAIYEDERMKYCAYNHESRINVIDYIKIYQQYPIAEMMMKLKCFRLINERALKIISENKPLRKYIFVNSNDIQYLAFQTVYNAYKKNPNGNPLDYYNSLMCRINSGKELKEISREIYSKLLKYSNQEKIDKYLKDFNIPVNSYNDYLTAVDWLRLDLSDTKVLFPKNFREMHDEYTKQYFDYMQDEERRKNDDLNKGMSLTAQLFNFLEYSNGIYTVEIAKTKNELINEGEKLRHCVGRMDYDKRQVNGKSCICFIRRNKEVAEPYVTAEISLTDGEIKQCYGFKDSVIPEVNSFKEEWKEYYLPFFKEMKKEAKTNVVI